MMTVETRTETAYFDKNDRLTLHTEGYARIRNKYNDKGQIIEQGLSWIGRLTDRCIRSSDTRDEDGLLTIAAIYRKWPIRVQRISLSETLWDMQQSGIHMIASAVKASESFLMSMARRCARE